MLKKTYSKDKKYLNVTFSVTPEAAEGAKSISLAGDFNNWNVNTDMLKKDKDGNFSLKLKLKAGKDYQFRYLYDNSKWQNEWHADSYVYSQFASADNSVVNC